MENKNKEKHKKKNTKKKKKIIGKIILIILLIVVISIGIWFGYRTHKNGGGLGGMLATAIGHDEYTKKNLKELRVLLLGVSTDIDAELTDTIIVASYNPNTQKANLLSIPRDTFTGKNSKKAVASQKINALYNIEKTPEKTLKAVNELTGLDIQYYAIIKTEALVKLVDTIGGVDFNVPIDMEYDDTSQDLHINLKQGQQKLNGDQAEQLLRFRHSNENKRGVMTSYPTEYGDNDFGRMRTQRDFIIETARQTIKIGNIFKIGQIMEIIHTYIETNIDLNYLKDYLPYIVEFDADNIQAAMLPGTTPDFNTTNGVSIFLMDEKEAKQLIESMFGTPTEETEQSSAENTIETSATVDINDITIELLDGSGNKEKFEKAKQQLEEAGFEVKKTGTSTNMSKTIITNKKDATEEQLKAIKEALSVGSISTNKSSTSLVDVTIVIGEDF